MVQILAQLTVETLHVGVLRRLARLDVHQVDLALQSSSKKNAHWSAPGVVTANRARQTALDDDMVKHPRNAQAREARVYLHGQALALKRVDHVEDTDRTTQHLGRHATWRGPNSRSSMYESIALLQNHMHRRITRCS